MGKAQGLQGTVPPGLVGQLLLGPGEEGLALGLEEGPQFGGAGAGGEEGLLLAGDIEVDQCQLHLVQPAFGAQQPAVDAHLGPVQVTVIVGLAGQVTAVGLHLFQTVACRVVAVGATAHLQRAERAGQGHFALVAVAPPGRHQGVAGDAFLGRGRGGEAQVEVAALGGEFAQGPHRHAVGHAGRASVSAHCT